MEHFKLKTINYIQLHNDFNKFIFVRNYGRGRATAYHGYVGDPNHEEDVITPIRSEIEHYTNLLNLSEKRLTSKIEPLFQE